MGLVVLTSVTTPPCRFVLVLNSSLPVTGACSSSSTTCETDSPASKSSPRRCSKCASTAAKSHAGSGSGSATRLTRRRAAVEGAGEGDGEAASDESAASREAQGSRSSCALEGVGAALALALDGAAVEVGAAGRDVTEREKDALEPSSSEAGEDEDELTVVAVPEAVVVGTGT